MYIYDFFTVVSQKLINVQNYFKFATYSASLLEQPVKGAEQKTASKTNCSVSTESIGSSTKCPYHIIIIDWSFILFMLYLIRT